MKLMTISQVSDRFAVSTRTLRYYEQIGLLESRRLADYAYRTYDANALERLRAILILRRLRIPLRQIHTLLAGSPDSDLLRTFHEKRQELDEEIRDLEELRGTLSALITRIGSVTKRTFPPVQDLLQDDRLRDLLFADVYESTCEPERTPERKVPAMNPFKLNDVRILTLPPCTVAASHFIGPDPEQHVTGEIETFVRDTRLWERFPELRSFGFNHPNPSASSETYGYELWVTVPEDMDIPAPLERKTFAGGLYAAHMIPFGQFQEWNSLMDWVRQSAEYAENTREDGGACMYGLLEEHINFVAHMRDGYTMDDLQLDLLCPVRKRI